MDLDALQDWKTTGPGLGLMLENYLVSHHLISAPWGDILSQIITLGLGIFLLAVNSRRKEAMAASFIGSDPPASILPAPGAVLVPDQPVFPAPPETPIASVSVAAAPAAPAPLSEADKLLMDAGPEEVLKPPAPGA